MAINTRKLYIIYSISLYKEINTVSYGNNYNKNMNSKSKFAIIARREIINKISGRLI